MAGRPAEDDLEATGFISRMVAEDPAGVDGEEGTTTARTITFTELRKCRYHIREFIRLIREPNPDIDGNPTTAVICDEALDHLARAYVKYLKPWTQRPSR